MEVLGQPLDPTLARAVMGLLVVQAVELFT